MSKLAEAMEALSVLAQQEAEIEHPQIEAVLMLLDDHARGPNDDLCNMAGLAEFLGVGADRLRAYWHISKNPFPIYIALPAALIYSKAAVVAHVKALPSLPQTFRQSAVFGFSHQEKTEEGEDIRVNESLRMKQVKACLETPATRLELARLAMDRFSVPDGSICGSLKRLLKNGSITCEGHGRQKRFHLTEQP